MRLGITLPHYDYSFDSSKPVEFADVAKAAQLSESVGFDALYVSDHLTLDLGKYGGKANEKSGEFPKFQSLEALSTLAALAPLTKTSTLGTLVLCEALRHPVMTAAIATTINDVASGRFALGLGAGWHDPDYEIYGDEMPSIGDRMTRLSESMKIIRDLIHGETLKSSGEFYSSNGATLESPLLKVASQKHKVPLFIGGKGDRLLRIVARYADGWNTCWAYEFDVYQDRVDSLRRACEKYDRDLASVYQSLGLYCMVADTEKELEDYFQNICDLSPAGVADGRQLDSWRQSRLVGTTEQVAEQIAKWANLGVKEIIVNPGFAPFHVGSYEIIEHLGKSLRKACELAGEN